MKKITLLVIVLILVVSMTGCGNKANLEKGFAYTFTPDEIMFGVRSDTDTFDNGSVSFDVYYGVHDIGKDEKYDNDPKLTYTKEGHETIFFGLYICNGEYALDVVNDMEIPDYKMIDNYYFVKEISEEEAFSGDYGFTMSYLKGITYNHSEEITIPAEFFAGETGSIAVKLIAFHEPVEEGGNYYTSTASHIKLRYEKIDDNTIKFIF